MAEEKKIKRRVLQGHSVQHQGIWFHQAEVFECGEEDEFIALAPMYDQDGKYLGDRHVESTEAVLEPVKPEAPKAEKSKKNQTPIEEA